MKHLTLKFLFWLHPDLKIDRRVIIARELGRKLGEERADCARWRKRAIDAEDRLREMKFMMQTVIQKHDRDHGTMIGIY